MTHRAVVHFWTWKCLSPVEFHTSQFCVLCTFCDVLNTISNGSSPTTFRAGLSFFRLGAENSDMCHVQPLDTRTIEAKARGYRYTLVQYLVCFSPLYWTSAYLSQVAGNGDQNMRDREISHSDVIWSVFSPSLSAQDDSQGPDFCRVSWEKGRCKTWHITNW